jgi:glycine hydroxymethyltransferase
MLINRDALLRSLTRQREILEGSIILTPVDSLPLFRNHRTSTTFLHGIYASDKLRTPAQKRSSAIQFAGRTRITYDIQRIQRTFADALGAHAVSFRLLSGLHAHVIGFMGLANIGDTVFLLPERAGGHFATKGILERLGLRVVEAPTDDRRLMIDREKSLAVISKEKPRFIFIDRSEGLKYEDFSYFGELQNVTKIFDSSQYLPQIMNGEFANPFSWGFDLQLFTLHKSFPGPQKAGAATRCDDEIWERFLAGAGAYVSSSHVENTYLAAFALCETEALGQYAGRLTATAIALEEALAACGAPIVLRHRQGCGAWPNTHHVWLLLASEEQAFNAWRSLEKIRIQTNYRRLPYGLGWGLRLGVTTAVMRGLTPDSVAPLARLLTDALRDGPSSRLRRLVRSLAATLARDAISTWKVFQ